MKNDIDDLLNSMFRGGKLNVRGSGQKDSKEEGSVPALEWDPEEHAKKAEKAVSSLEKAQGDFSKDLGESIEQLTKDTQAELHKLEQRLKEDGAESQSAGNAGNVPDVEQAFSGALEETKAKLYGQNEFLSALTVAMKRPFIVGVKEEQPLCRAAVLGKPGTGKHRAIELMAASLMRRGILKNPKAASIDLSRYGDPGSEKLFFQDLYAALKSGACGLLFEKHEGACPAVLSLVSTLFQEGAVPLPGRYVEQKGMLVSIDTALVPNAISSLSGAGKYLFLISEKSRGKLADAFGMQFLSSLDDICETAAFSEESLQQISERILKELCGRIEKKLGFSCSCSETAPAALVASFLPEEGIPSLEREAELLYQAVSEARLKQGLQGITGELAAENSRLCVRYETAGKPEVICPSDDLGNAAREAAVKEVKAELDEIVGLKEVKEYVLSLEDNFKIQQMRKEKGLKAEAPSMHMIFTGNPGTGKTTVARIVARYLKAIGVLRGGQLVEVTRADLVGKYVGHTAPLTQQAIQSALGGVLFVDEAYSLYRGKDDSFGLEAIDTLVKGMEDHRDDLLVVLAGYSREMGEFLTANSGLRSRFPNIIEFPDYTGEELLLITKSIVKGKGYRLDEACEKPLLRFFTAAQTEGDPRVSGNGRMARNKVEEAVLNCSRRNMKLPEEQRDLELLLPEDFGLGQEPEN